MEGYTVYVPLNNKNEEWLPNKDNKQIGKMREKDLREDQEKIYG